MKPNVKVKWLMTKRAIAQAARSVYRVWASDSMWSSSYVGSSTSEPYERVYLTEKYTKIETLIDGKNVCLWVTSKGMK
jgi:hypothetical protein